MGLTHITARIANPGRPSRTERLRLLVDSGAIYSVVPATILRRLGIRPHGTRSFILADGTEITRPIGDAIFLINGDRGASPVIFGQKGDSALLGMVSLEAVGLLLDPIRRVLRPLPLILGGSSR
jgi:predicted aspartyl protease